MTIAPMPQPWDYDTNLMVQVSELLTKLMESARPSAEELVAGVEGGLGPKARWYIAESLLALAKDGTQQADLCRYVRELLDSSDLFTALIGATKPDLEAHSGIDELIQAGRAYWGSEQFKELIRFLARFTEYSPYNNLLVWVQRPGCQLFATRSKWQKQFKRRVAEGARPMVILAPRTPVLLVYDIDDTEGPPLPQELDEFAKFEGTWDPDWLARMVENAGRHYSIRVDFKTLTSMLAGFATIDRGVPGSKMRIVVHDGLDEPSRFGVLCHELAHVLLGHLGNDDDRWWPNRYGIDRHSIEVEAEGAAFITTRRLGLRGASARYVSRHLLKGDLPPGVSPDHIAKVSGRLEQMATGILPERVPGKARRRRGGRGLG